MRSRNLKPKISSQKPFRLVINGLLLILSIFLASPALAISDPMTLGGGARVLGLGRAYVGYAENAEAMFVNPAGLGKIESLKATAMQANLLNDLNYMLLGGAYPVVAGHAVGLGYAGMGTADIDLRDSDGTSLGTGSYQRAVYFLSYGAKGDKISPWISDQFYLGSNLKYFSYALSGSEAMDSGDGGGFDMDMSLLYQANPWLSLGFTQQDLLPEGMGGRITFANGYSEGISSVSKLGSKIEILGNREDALRESDLRLSVGLDADFYVDEAMPMAMHLGSELWPTDIIAFRLGLDQDPSDASGVVTNVSGGVGIRYHGIEFDYAYHPYSSFSDDVTHYFSVALVGEEQDPFRLLVDAPTENLITKDEKIKISGRVEGLKKSKLSGLWVGNQRVTLAADHSFSAEVPLKIGKNLIEISANRNDGASSETKKKVLRLRAFSDVIEQTLAKTGIEYFGTLGLTDGYPDGSFRPDNFLTRIELTTLLVRTTNLETPVVYGKIFKDIAAEHWANKYLKIAKDFYLVEGYPDGSFKPNKEINRAEGVVVVARFDNDITYAQKVYEKPFRDIAASHWAAPQLEVTKKAGMLSYISGDSFQEKTAISRAQFAYMLEKTGIGQALIKNLLNFDVGYDSAEEKLVYVPNKSINHRKLNVAQKIIQEEKTKLQDKEKDRKIKKDVENKKTAPRADAQINLTRLRAYLRKVEGTDIVGKAKHSPGSSVEIYVLGNGKFLYVSGKQVDIYDARAGAWKKLDGQLIASL